jgi:hypothetical protein
MMYPMSDGRADVATTEPDDRGLAQAGAIAKAFRSGRKSARR